MSITEPDCSIVIPVKNEAACLETLTKEIVTVYNTQKWSSYEIIYVDDGSTDETLAILLAMRSSFPNLRILHHKESCGQSAALYTGIHAAHAPLIVTLDGDGQNDPANIPALIDCYQNGKKQYGLVIGRRTKRQDIWHKKLASRLANTIRAYLLKDNTMDTGCGLKVFRREDFLRLPYFDHMHRYLPALMKREGLEVISINVNHRTRHAGCSNYGNWKRLWVGIWDLIGVMWLLRRRRLTKTTERTNDHVL